MTKKTLRKLVCILSTTDHIRIAKMLVSNKGSVSPQRPSEKNTVIKYPTITLAHGTCIKKNVNNLPLACSHRQINAKTNFFRCDSILPLHKTIRPYKFIGKS